MLRRIARWANDVLLVAVVLAWVAGSAGGGFCVINSPGSFVVFGASPEVIHARALIGEYAKVQYRVSRVGKYAARPAEYWTTRHMLRHGAHLMTGSQYYTFEVTAPSGAVLEWSFSGSGWPDSDSFPYTWFRARPAIGGTAVDVVLLLPLIVPLLLLSPCWRLLVRVHKRETARRMRRFRRRGVCPRCEYNLTGNVSGVCPECGAAVAEFVPREPGA